MTYCTHCGHPNAEGAALCANCGAALGRTCEHCGKLVPAGSQFCNYCGARMGKSMQVPAATRPADDRVRKVLRALMPDALATKMRTAARETTGERREITALLWGTRSFRRSTGDAAHPLDSEQLYLISDEVMRLLADIVYKYEGTIDKFTGDNLVALFGVPVTHENNAERAVRAALDMHGALKPLAEKIQATHGIDFRSGIGVHTGAVIVSHIDSQLHVNYTVVGNTIDLAASLQAAAAPDTTLVSFEVYQRTHPLVNYRALPPIDSRKTARPIRVYQPSDMRAEPGRVRGLPGMQVPMIGREGALQTLTETLADVASAQHSRVALVTGEAGVGKSRLMFELRNAISETEYPVYQGTCMTYARAKPLHLFASLLRSIFHLSETDPVEVQHKSLHNYLARLGMDNPDTFAYLCSVLGLDLGDEMIQSRLRYIDDEVLQKMTHSILVQVLVAVARVSPTILIFEDLHWVDTASKSMVAHLLQTVDDAPLFIIMISRDVERETVIKPLVEVAQQRKDALLDIQLAPLSETDSAHLVDQLIRQTSDEALALKQQIVKRADGNPFYAEEIIRMLIDQGGLVQRDGMWHVLPIAGSLTAQVPGTLTGLVMARFDRLPESVRRTVQKAAVLGSVFPVEVLELIAGTSAIDVSGQIEVLVQRQFLVPETLEYQRGYAFRHALIQEAIYGTLLKRDRQRFHGQVAETLERNDYDVLGDRNEALSYHFAESAQPVRAVPYLIAAAENAAHRCAYETAVTRYRKALDLMVAGDVQDQDRILQVQIGLGRSLKFSGDYTEASTILEKALRDALYMRVKSDIPPMLSQLISGLNELSDIRHREGASEEAIEYLQAALSTVNSHGRQANITLWRMVIDRMAWVRFHQGRLEEAFELASSGTHSVDLEHADDPITSASLYNTLGGVLWQQGNLQEAVTYVERSLHLYERMDYQWGMANAYANLGVLHYTLGNWPQAAEILARAESLQKQVGDIQHRAITLNNLGTLRLAIGQHGLAKQHFESSLEIFEQLGDAWGAAQVHVGLARLALIQGRFDDAIAHGESTLQTMDTVGAYGVEARSILALSRSEEDLAAGLEIAEGALQMAQDAGLVEQEADCRRVLGLLHARNGDYLEAESLLRESVDLALQTNAPYTHGVALFALGQLYGTQMRNDPAERGEWRARAIQMYQEASDQFGHLGAVYDLKLVRGAMAALEAVQEPAPKPEVREPLPGVDREPERGASAERYVPTPIQDGVPEGGRREATVVWLTLTADADADEEVFESIALVMPTLVEIINERQGQLIQRHDGLTVVFGAPVAFEDDAERAVQMAWQMVHVLADNMRDVSDQISFGVAVSQGDVVAGFVGPRFHTEFEVRGETVQEAQLISAYTPPGEVWVTHAVLAATERICIYKPVELEAGHPLARTSALWALDGFRVQPRPARGVSGIHARLIGRDTPLQAMLGLSQNLERGIGGLVWIEGEPGIGKSRLMEEFVTRIPDPGALILAGRCSPQKSSLAFSLISDVLAQIFDVQPQDTSTDVRAKMEEAFAVWPRDARATRPYLEVLLGLWPEGMIGDRLSNLDPDQLRQQTFVALRRLFKSLSNQGQLVLLLDDLHWIDPVSAEALQFLLTIVATAPILFVCAQRRQGGDAPNDRLVRVQSLIPTQTVRFLLERLDVEEREALLSELLPHAQIPRQLRKAILDQSEGNPYFIEEYIRMFIDEGYLQYRENRWAMRPDLTADQVTMPSSLETLIRSRVDALPSELKEVIQIAAVIGAPLEVEVLQAVAARADVTAILGRLASRLLMRKGSEDGQWFFHHSLIEDVVYDTMLVARRRALHLKVSKVLKARWSGSEGEHAEVLAYHLMKAGENSEALEYLMLAGERAALRSANEAAINYFEQAAEVLSMQPATISDGIRWRLAAGLGDVYRSLGRHADSMAALKAGLVLMETGLLSSYLRAGLYRRMGRTARQMGEYDLARQYYTAALRILGEPDTQETYTEMARTLNELAFLNFQQGRLEEAMKICDASMVYAQRAGDLNALAAAENTLGGIYFGKRSWTEAAHHTRRAMVLREQMGFTWGVASTLGNLGLLAVLEGEWHKAKSFFERSLVMRQEMGDVDGVTLVHNNLGTLNRDQGHLDIAEQHFRESLDVARPFELNFHIANSTIGLAQVLWLKGDLSGTREAVSAALELAREIDTKEVLAEIYRLQAEMLVGRKMWSQAKSSAMTALGYAETIGNRGWSGGLWRLISEIEMRCGDFAAAHRALESARQALVDATEAIEDGRYHLQASRLARLEGRVDDAGVELQAARKIFMKLGATRDLQQTEDHYSLSRTSSDTIGAD